LSSKVELTDFLKEQIKIENRIVESLNSSLGEMGNPAVRGVLKGISLDSVEHAEMYASAVNLLTSVQARALGETITEEDWWDVLWKNVPFHGAPGG